MTRSFYHYILTLRGNNPDDALQVLAHDIACDQQFPKQSEEYHEISSYLEMNADYLSTMTIFDQAWELYLDHNQM